MGSQPLLQYLEPLVNDFGLSAILIFPCMDGDKTMKDAFDEAKNPLLRVVPLIKKKFPNLLIMSDVCLCTFNENGIFVLILI